MDACVIAAQKNRYKAWLNNLPLDESLNRWTKIKKFVEGINTTNRETILKGWEKTKLNREFDLDECMKDKDFEEEFLLNEQMKELMLNDEETSGLNEQNEEQEKSENEPRNDVDTTETVIKKKQPQITDFFAKK